MTINNLPTELVNAIQLGYLERAFHDGLYSKLAYATAAEEKSFPVGIGESMTTTRTGLLKPVETPLDPTTNTNFDNGLTPSNFSIEQYTMRINQYGLTSDVNSVTSRVAIAPLMIQYQDKHGINAGQSLDRLCKKAIFNTYNGGNTFVTETLGAPADTIKVDDIREFNEISVNGKMEVVSVTNPRSVLVGTHYYNLINVTADAINISNIKSIGGISGTLTFATNVLVADGTIYQPVVAKYSPVILRPNARATYHELISTDTLTLRAIREAAAILHNNNVPTFSNGAYRLFLDWDTMNGLYLDQQFKEIFYSRFAATPFTEGYIGSISGVDFYLTTEAYQQSYGNLRIRRPLLVSPGALVKGNFEGMADAAVPKNAERNENVVVRMSDNIVYTIRPPLDRLGQIYALSWYWIGGFAVPTDVTATTDIIPTATESYYKRAVVIECV